MKKLVRKTVFMEIIETEKVKPEYWIAASQIELMEEIYFHMEKNGLNQSDVARKMGTERAYVSRLLGGNINCTIETLIKLAMASGMKNPILCIKEGYEEAIAKERKEL